MPPHVHRRTTYSSQNLQVISLYKLKRKKIFFFCLREKRSNAHKVEWNGMGRRGRELKSISWGRTFDSTTNQCQRMATAWKGRGKKTESVNQFQSTKFDIFRLATYQWALSLLLTHTRATESLGNQWVGMRAVEREREITKIKMKSCQTVDDGYLLLLTLPRSQTRSVEGASSEIHMNRWISDGCAALCYALCYAMAVRSK